MLTKSDSYDFFLIRSGGLTKRPVHFHRTSAEYWAAESGAWDTFPCPHLDGGVTQGSSEFPESSWACKRNQFLTWFPKQVKEGACLERQGMHEWPQIWMSFSLPLSQGKESNGIAKGEPR